MIRKVALPLLALALLACATPSSEAAGVMLEVSAPSSLKDRVAELAVRLYAGRDDHRDFRDQGTEPASAWPAEIFLRLNAERPMWLAEVRALDASGSVLATGEAEGVFSDSAQRVARIYLQQHAADTADAASAESEDGAVLPGDEGNPLRDASVDTEPREPDANSADRSSTSDAGPPIDTTLDATSPVTSEAGGKGMDAGVDNGAVEPDSTTSSTTGDASSAPEPSVLGLCAAAPNYPTTTACARCTCAKCTAQLVQCYASSDTQKNAQCAQVNACQEQNQCVQRGCYCGTVSSCLLPNGPCVNVIEQVVGGGALSVSRAEGDPEHALGRASLIGACRVSQCRSECGLN